MFDWRQLTTKDGSEILRNIIVCAAYLLGGAWVIWNFTALGAMQRSRLEIDRMVAESKRSPIVNVRLNVEQISHENKGVYLLANVEIENVGTATAQIDFEDDSEPLAVARIIAKKNQAAAFESCTPFESSIRAKVLHIREKKPKNRADDTLGAKYIGPGAIWRVPFMVRVNEPGAYLVEFRHNMDADEDAKKRGRKHHLLAASQIVFVAPPAKESAPATSPQEDDSVNVSD